MAVTNFLTALVIARNFDESYFATYLSIAALLSIISIPMQSIQNAYATHTDAVITDFSKSNNNDDGIKIKKLITILTTIWLCSLPILHEYSNIHLSTLISSTALYVVLIPGAIVAGKLRKAEKFGEWRLLLSAASLIQIPIVFLVVAFKLSLWAYLLLMSIPTLTFACMAIFIFKIHNTVKNKSVFIRWPSLLYSLVSSYSLQLPLILSLKLLGRSEVGSLFIFYIFSISISLGGVFGSFSVPSFMVGRFSDRIFSKLNFVFCLPSIIVGSLFLTPLKEIIPELFGRNYVITLSDLSTWIFVLSSVVWSVYAAHSQVKLGQISWTILGAGIFVLLIEWIYLINFVNSIEEVIFAHLVTSILQSLILYFGPTHALPDSTL
jgi:hypothetical protein